MILRWFLFSLQAIYKFLISTCYFARLDGLSVGNMIPDLLSSSIFNEKSLFGPWLQYIIALNSFTFALENIIPSSKTSLWSI